MQLHVQAQADQCDAEQKRNPPAPYHELIARYRLADDQKCEVRQDDAGWRADLYERAINAASVLRCSFGHHQRRAAPLTTDREALHDTQHDEDDWRDRSGDGVRWETSDQRRAGAHDRQCSDQRSFPPSAIAVVSEQDAADRSREEADCKRAERRHQGDVRRHVSREKHIRKYERCCRSVYEEVVPLDTRTRERRERNLPYSLLGELLRHHAWNSDFLPEPKYASALQLASS